MLLFHLFQGPGQLCSPGNFPALCEHHLTYFPLRFKKQTNKQKFLNPLIECQASQQTRGGVSCGLSSRSEGIWKKWGCSEVTRCTESLASISLSLELIQPASSKDPGHGPGHRGSRSSERPRWRHYKENHNLMLEQWETGTPHGLDGQTVKAPFPLLQAAPPRSLGLPPLVLPPPQLVHVDGSDRPG